MKLLDEVDYYIKVANFGTAEMIDEFTVDEETKTLAKITALKRLQKTLEMLVNNTTFAVKKADRKLMLQYRETIIKVREALPKTEKTIRKESIGGNSQTKVINEVAFNKMLSFLEKFHHSILNPLNRADLIFQSVDEFDPLDWKKRAIHELENEG